MFTEHGGVVTPPRTPTFPNSRTPTFPNSRTPTVPNSSLVDDDQDERYVGNLLDYCRLRKWPVPTFLFVRDLANPSDTKHAFVWTCTVRDVTVKVS